MRAQHPARNRGCDHRLALATGNGHDWRGADAGLVIVAQNRVQWVCAARIAPQIEFQLNKNHKPYTLFHLQFFNP